MISGGSRICKPGGQGGAPKARVSRRQRRRGGWGFGRECPPPQWGRQKIIRFLVWKWRLLVHSGRLPTWRGGRHGPSRPPLDPPVVIIDIFITRWLYSVECLNADLPKSKTSPGSSAVATARIPPIICQGQPGYYRLQISSKSVHFQKPNNKKINKPL